MLDALAVAEDLGRVNAQDRLVGALQESRDLLRDDEPAVLTALLAQLQGPGDPGAGESPAQWLARRLETFADADERRRLALADLLGLAARALALDGRVPSDAAGAAAWRATLTTVDRLYGGGAHRLGRLRFIDDERLIALLVEAAQSQRTANAEAQQLGDPGPALRDLAVDPQLAAAVSDAVGFSVTPSYRAVYMYFAPGARIQPHVDHADYEVIFHLTLEHVPPEDGSGRAALVVFRLDEPPLRVELAPGEAIALRGRGSIHTREPINAGEHWTTLAIGFKPQATRR
jgi:hypothetical protein